MERIYKIGTRASPLALKQVDEVMGSLRKLYPAFTAEVVEINTYGDRDRITPISEMEGTDFFTRDIDEALWRGEIDFAVHSAKDLPYRLRAGLIIAVMTSSVDPYDVLVSKSGLKLDKLPLEAKIGTSSLHRQAGLEKYRSDFRVIDMRGNIEERLEKLDSGDLDAIVIAAAGLLRLGLNHRITQRISFKIFKPHPLQGRLAIVARENDEDIIGICRECLS